MTCGPPVKKSSHHRVDCFVVGLVVGLLSASTLVKVALVGSGMYAAVIATLTLPPLGLQLQTSEHGSRRSMALSIAWQYVLGAVAVVAGLSIGIRFAP